MESRLHNLKTALRLEWGELADKLEMSRSMLDFVRKGQRNLSPPALRRLEDLERSCGLLQSVLNVNSTRESGPVYHAEPTQKKVNMLDAVQEIKRIRDSLDKLERILKGDDDGTNR